MQVDFYGKSIKVTYENTKFDVNLLPGFIQSRYESSFEQDMDGVFLRTITIQQEHVLSPIPIVEPIKFKLSSSSLCEETNKVLKHFFSEYAIQLRVRCDLYFSIKLFNLLAEWITIDRVILNATHYATRCTTEKLLQHVAPTRLEMRHLTTHFTTCLPSVTDVIWKWSFNDFSAFPNMSSLSINSYIPIFLNPQLNVKVLKLVNLLPKSETIESWYKNGLETLYIEVNCELDDRIDIQACPDLKLVVNGKVISKHHTDLIDLV
jgi:hypothetical protein